MRKVLQFALFAVLGCSFAVSQTTTTITGTVRDLAQALVTSGKVTFDLRPSRDTTIAGYSRFSPQTITCTITGAGLIKALDGVSACIVTMNTALQPTGTYYVVSYWPANVKTATFSFYAVAASYDWSAVVPTPTTSPAQNFVDIFSNQSIGGNKTWLGTQTFSGTTTFAGTNIFSGTVNMALGAVVSVSGTGCGTTLQLLNIDTSPVNPNKYFRVKQSNGALELVNSACSIVIVSVDDAGNGTLAGNLNILGSALNGGATTNSSSPNPFTINSIGTYNLTNHLNGNPLNLVTPNGVPGITLPGFGGPINFTLGANCATGGCPSVGTPYAFSQIGTNSYFAAYNGKTTVGMGFPVQVAAVDATAQTAAIVTTTLYTTGVDSFPASISAQEFRLSWNAKVTTVAGTSSTLGALTVVYTDPDGVVQTITAPATIAAGTIATSSAGNTTATVLLGLPLLLNCKAATNITYAFAYASNAANVMAYNLHIRLEAF